MHKKHARDGLVVVSVNLDNPTDKDTRRRVIDFLKEKKASFTNLVLDDKEDVAKWAKELKISGLPVTDVYDRAGRRVKRIEGLDSEALDEVAGKLLKK